MAFAISFLIPVIIWLLGVAASGIFPFGNNTILMSDMGAQYIGYFEFIRNVLTEGVSPLFSLYKGMGEETLGVISYYLMSPFNLIVALFPKENITEAILTINLLKIGCCGLTFSIFLKNKFKNSNMFVIAAFSTAYALMAYNIVYQFNIMWLDGVIWLPIIIMGIDKIVDENKSWLFYVSLTIAIISNWYIGFMLCIFSVFWMIYRLINKADTKLTVTVFKKVCLFGILSVGTALVVIFPAIVTTVGEWARQVDEPSVINYKFLDIFSKFIIGGYDFTQITDPRYNSECLNLPNIFAGVTVLLLFITYYFNPNIDKKDKIRSGVFFIILIIMTIILPLNKAWHVFSTNVWFPYRYSFCITFFMIYIAYNAFLNIDSIELKMLLKILLSIIGACFIIEKLNYTYIISELIWCTIFVAVAGFISLKLVKEGQKNAKTIFMLVLCFDVLLNAVVCFGKNNYGDRNIFYAQRDILAEKTEEIKSQDEGYYRIENNILSDLNAYMGSSLLGVGSSSSMGKENIRKFGDTLGYSRVSNNFGFSPLTSFADSFLGVKYYITEDKEVIRNDNALALGFLVNEEIKNIKSFPTEYPKCCDSFEKQNELARETTGIKENLFDKIDIYNVKFENLQEIAENIYSKKYLSVPAKYSFSFDVKHDNKDIYIKINERNLKAGNLYVNGNEVACDEKFVVNLGKFNKGDTINVELEVENTDSVRIENAYAYYENVDVLENVIQELKKSELNIEKMSGSAIEGKINVTENNKILLFSIPYDTYLRVFVDDVEVETECVLDTLLAVNLNQGEHTIKVDYYPDYLIKVVGFSGAFMTLAFVLIIVENRSIKHEE